ncbi:efflux transporter outer membrane subunit [Stenotrophomonas maltophilia]|uniref:efflux transporter outer membrane subunit n=1 Tax=Stenotrophomonas maltophilia TaxID=40324 RepID=UPI002A9CF858|nr:efflux transporter outer membrane subunit [Stenotrophomonas maltophilia]
MSRALMPAPTPIALLAPLVLALAGCATSADVQAPRLDRPQLAVSAQSSLIASSGSLTDAPVPSQWWSLFADPTLSELQRQALESNLDVQTAAARIEESRAQLGIVRSARLPQIQAQASYSRGALSENSPMVALGAPTDPSDTWAAGFQASWELDLWGYHKRRAESASASLEATGFGLEAARTAVAAEVSRTYLLLRGVQAREAITERNHDIAQKLVQLTESRRANGIASRYETAAAHAAMLEVEAGQTQLAQQRAVLMNALALLVAKSPRELNEQLAHGQLPAMPTRLAVGIPSEVARNRADILQADAKLRAAVADIGAAKADFYPRISLTGSLGVQAFDESDLGDWGSRQFSVGPTLHLPIFQGGRLKSNLALTEARHQLAGIAYKKTVLKAWHEVDDALTNYTSELTRNQQLEQAQANNQIALDVARRAYQEGRADMTTVLMAQRTLLASDSSLVESKTSSALAVVAIYRALGGGWSDQVVAAVGAGGERS